jgi:hypothetical protein
MSVTMPNKKKNGKWYISTKRPNISEEDPELKETHMSFNDTTHNIIEGKKEHFSKIKKKLQKKTV